MKLGLGIDTGGTFTDAVVIDLATMHVIAKAKSPTTYQDLSIGIMDAIKKVVSMQGVDTKSIQIAGLSTTLATNSILQGKGGEVGLIGIGWVPLDDWNFECKRSRFIKGGYDSLGKQNAPLDEEELTRAVKEVSSEVDSIVVSGMFSVINPLQETRAKQIVKDLTGLPIILGHELTGDLGIYERTVTAVLNAKLLPVIEEFLASVEKALKVEEIDARVYVFKGDGGLMTLEMAKERPVETIVSGPAASLMGGRALADRRGLYNDRHGRNIHRHRVP